MKTIERLQEYKDYMRTEARKEEHELFEDLLLLAKLAEQSAKAAYAAARCPEDKKAEGEKLLEESVAKLREQYVIFEGYFGGGKV